MSVADWMPEPLLYMGPGGLAAWQWLGLATVAVLAWLIARLGASVFTWLGSKLVGRTSTSFDDDLLAELRSPLRMLAAIGLIRVGELPLELPAEPVRILHRILLALFAVSLVWAALRAIEV